MSSEPQPTNLIELMQSARPVDAGVLRSHYPAWIDDDIRQNLEQVLQDPIVGKSSNLSGSNAVSNTPAAAGAEWQHMLQDMMNDLKSKMYAHQYQQQSLVPPHHHIRRSRDDLQQPGSARSVNGGGHARRQSTSMQRQNSASSLNGGSHSRRGSTAVPAAGAAHHRGSSINSRGSIVIPSIPLDGAILRPMSPHSINPHSPRTPRSAAHSRASSLHAGSESSITVPIDWFNTMESRLARLMEMGNPATLDAATKAAELQRVKYAMLISKLEEMNRLHREVLNEEHQKQHLHDLETLQKQHLREFQGRLDAVTKENERLLQERDRERESLHKQRESERQVLDKWSNEKDLALDALRQHFLERERLLMESHRQSESAYQEQKNHQYQLNLEEMQRVDAERRSWDSQKKETELFVGQLQEQVRQLTSSLNTTRLEQEQNTRKMAMINEENGRLKAKVNEASARMALVDNLESLVSRLRFEASEREEMAASKDKYWKEAQEELEAREDRLRKLRVHLDEQESHRREARRRERREAAFIGTTAASAAGGKTAEPSLYKAATNDFDCAWASGPVDRRALAVPQPAQHYR